MEFNFFVLGIIFLIYVGSHKLLLEVVPYMVSILKKYIVRYKKLYFIEDNEWRTEEKYGRKN